MTNQPTDTNSESYFPTCPYCGTEGEMLNAGRSHWLICRAHGVKWNIGANLFSGWRDESEDERRLSAAILAGLRNVTHDETGDVPAF